jgi:alpha-glucosidase
MNAIFDTLPVWHDHTPAYTQQLFAKQGSTVTIRLKTLLEPVKVRLVACIGGENFEFEAHPIAALDGEGQWFEYSLELKARVNRYCWVLVLDNDIVGFSKAGLTHTRRPYRDWFSFVADYQAPEWVWQSVFYQIFPDRFRMGTAHDRVQEGEYTYPRLPENLLDWLEGDPRNRNTTRSRHLRGSLVMAPDWDTPLEDKSDVHAHYGGDLEGIVEAIPHLLELGVNALWLNPIFDSPSNHRYDARDYRAVDPHIGGNAAFGEMMTALKHADIRVILDGVLNHIGNEHPLFEQAYAQENSELRQYFTFKDQGDTSESGQALVGLEEEQEPANTPPRGLPFESFFGVPTLPKLEYANEVVFEEFIDGPNSIVRHWLREGIDGWRLDVAQMMGQEGGDAGNLEIHRRLKNAARAENPDAYVFGERFQDPAAFLEDGSGEDASMNYHGFGLPVMEWLSKTNGRGETLHMDGEELLEILWDAYHVLPAPIALNQFNLLDSHDMARALYRLGQDKALFKVALTLLMSYPGVPCIFYGSEIGLTQHQKGSMNYCRQPMPWNPADWDTDLLEFSKKIIAYRRSSLVLQQGTLRILGASEDAIGYLREYTDAQGKTSRVACIAARTQDKDEPATLEFALPYGNWVDVLTNLEFGEGGPMRLEFAGVLLLEDNK